METLKGQYIKQREEGFEGPFPILCAKNSYIIKAKLSEPAETREGILRQPRVPLGIIRKRRDINQKSHLSF